MAKLKFEGMQEYEKMLSKLQTGTEQIIGKAVYAGAKIVADEIKANINSLGVEQGQEGGYGKLLSGITSAQKKGLQDGFGIAPMEYKKGFRSVKLGFDGYNATKTEKYPNGQPNVLIARAIEGGTSFRKKNPFVRKAIKSKKDAANKRMSEIIDEEISKITKG